MTSYRFYPLQDFPHQGILKHHKSGKLSVAEFISVERAHAEGRRTAEDADRISVNANVPHELAEIVTTWAQKQGRTLRQVRGESRDPDLVWIRRMITREARRRNYSFPQIGRALNRDHSTVMNYMNGSRGK